MCSLFLCFGISNQGSNFTVRHVPIAGDLSQYVVIFPAEHVSHFSGHVSVTLLLLLNSVSYLASRKVVKSYSFLPYSFSFSLFHSLFLSFETYLCHCHHVLGVVGLLVSSNFGNSAFNPTMQYCKQSSHSLLWNEGLSFPQIEFRDNTRLSTWWIRHLNLHILFFLFFSFKFMDTIQGDFNSH